MNKLLKVFLIFLLPLLTVLPLSGCADSGKTLSLYVDTPKDGTTVSTPAVTVSGQVKGKQSAAASVKVNDIDAPVKDGKYSVEVPLKEGQNIIKVVAAAERANLKEQRTVTYSAAK